MIVDRITDAFVYGKYEKLSFGGCERGRPSKLSIHFAFSLERHNAFGTLLLKTDSSGNLAHRSRVEKPDIESALLESCIKDNKRSSARLLRPRTVRAPVLEHKP